MLTTVITIVLLVIIVLTVSVVIVIVIIIITVPVVSATIAASSVHIIAFACICLVRTTTWLTAFQVLVAGDIAIMANYFNLAHQCCI
jgi:hypothetical protein